MKVITKSLLCVLALSFVLMTSCGGKDKASSSFSSTSSMHKKHQIGKERVQLL